MFVYCLSKLITEVVCMSTQMSTNHQSRGTTQHKPHHSLQLFTADVMSSTLGYVLNVNTVIS